ncbi:unnamed protein product [Cochlearia groenlandica]
MKFRRELKFTNDIFIDYIFAVVGVDNKFANLAFNSAFGVEQVMTLRVVLNMARARHTRLTIKQGPLSAIRSTVSSIFSVVSSSYMTSTSRPATSSSRPLRFLFDFSSDNWNADLSARKTSE